MPTAHLAWHQTFAQLQCHHVETSNEDSYGVILTLKRMKTQASRGLGFLLSPVPFIALDLRNEWMCDPSGPRVLDTSGPQPGEWGEGSGNPRAAVLLTLAPQGLSGISSHFSQGMCLLCEGGHLDSGRQYCGPLLI